MIRSETMRLIRKITFWLMAISIGIVKFIAIFAEDETTCRQIFVNNLQEIFTVFDMTSNFEWGGYVGLAVPCLCAFAVAGSILEDMEYQRYEYILPRSGLWKYIFSKIAAIFFAGSLCMLVGDLIYWLMGHFVAGLDYFPTIEEASYMYIDPMLKDGHFFTYQFLYEIRFCCFGVFISLITLLAALLIRNKKFVVVLPIVFMYLIMYVIQPNEITYFTIWFAPKIVYTTEGLWGFNHVACSLFALLYTLVAGIIDMYILHYVLERRRRG